MKNTDGKNKKYYILTTVLGIGILLGGLQMNGMNADLNNYAQTSVQQAIQGTQNSDEAPAAKAESLRRVLITPNSSQADKQLRGQSNVEVRHEFDGQFSANVPESAIKGLEKLAKVEEVPVWELLDNDKATKQARPVCGDGTKHPSEQCDDGNLENGDGCSSSCDIEGGPVDPPPSEDRTCEPTDQIEYNVAQVNGGSGGAGVTVAVLDSGTFTGHLDLDVQLCKDATKKGIRNGCNDADGHGTHTAGIVAANGGTDGLGLLGVAPDATLWSVKVCGTKWCFTDDIAAGINYAAGQGADIINLSLGGSKSSLVSNAIANHPETLVVAAAGNSGPKAGTIQYPGALAETIAVAAINSNKTVASFSSRGIYVSPDSTISEREVELSAGGVAVESTDIDGCYSAWSGTSFSSPTIAGLAAKLWNTHGNSNALDTRAYLRTIVEDITAASGGGVGAGYDIASGYGLPVAP